MLRGQMALMGMVEQGDLPQTVEAAATTAIQLFKGDSNVFLKIKWKMVYLLYGR